MEVLFMQERFGELGVQNRIIMELKSWIGELEGKLALLVNWKENIGEKILPRLFSVGPLINE
jgi:hypothetical protein